MSIRAQRESRVNQVERVTPKASDDETS